MFFFVHVHVYLVHGIISIYILKRVHSFDMHSYHTLGTCEYISSICNINWKSNKQKAMNLMIIYIYTDKNK